VAIALEKFLLPLPLRYFGFLILNHVGGDPDENCFTLTGTLGIQLQPFLGSKRKFRLEKTQSTSRCRSRSLRWSRSPVRCCGSNRRPLWDIDD